MNVRIFALIVTLAGTTLGCSLFLSKEGRYLFSAKDRATQEEVQQHLGPPSLVGFKAGQTVWTYETKEYVQGGNNSWTMVGTWWCNVYTLTFDDKEVLRHWTHSSKRCHPR